ncbi:(Fe-S)-binding protein [Williamsia serinedens]|uniref:Fe-S oxidoreductase n=1 Tax=Williamsia serinedens TaxID=391736 RepID=A0ABT1H345_9NOCA|nr:(Fe-S)-binding protein [Williamsia serinedens]MCP2161566.1 Fe-S oxidoreductase [Williamsia serinedens]
MNATTITIGTVAAALSILCWAFFVQGVTHTVRQILIGQKAPNRFTPVVPRFLTMVKEFAGHTRMVKFRTVGWAHWLVMVGFLLGSVLWFEAYGQTFDPEFHWPVVGAWDIYIFADEVLGLGTVIGILVLIAIRQRNHPRRAERLSRFSGSGFGAAYFVEAVVLLEGLGMIFVKTFKIASGVEDPPIWTSFFTHYLAMAFQGIDPFWVCIAAVIKLMSGMVWLAVVGRNITWGVAWHRFSAFFNIYFKREADGSVALGAAKPMTSRGKVLDMEEADPDVDLFGAGKIEDFSWKGWLDFSTCTECGRCQSQCPAWNTGKPLSPKLLITSLRDHANAKAPYLLAGGKTDMGGDEVGLVDADGNPDEARIAKIPEKALAEAARPLVGPSEGIAAGGVIDPDTLWSCTNCGACVEQCPVDIEHVDHIIDMRRYQVLIESDFPSELAGLFKNLENKGNPWGQNASTRNNWIDEMDIEIPVFGETVDTFEGFEYLFWVGCAGAFEDRAKKTTKAVAELLDIAAVNFLVLGQGETCTGDSARRAGNEFLFQMLAQQNIETLGEVFATAPEQKRKIVVTCAHCFNALGNEYPQLGARYEVVHHTQLLNRLVRDKRLIPVAPVAEDVTYHDPCFLGRHNKVYSEPRALMAASGSALREMPRHGERSMCCGAGGARMWMEESIGKRINLDRVDEALSTLPANGGEDDKKQKIATGCPFCRVMLSDGTTAKTSGTDREDKVEVVDVSQLLLEAVTRGAPEIRRGGRYLGPVVTADGDIAEESQKDEAAHAVTATTTEAEPAQAAAEATKTAPAAPKPTVGLGMGKGMKRPGKPSSGEGLKPESEQPAGTGGTPAKTEHGDTAQTTASAAAPAEPKAKGFGMGGAKRPGQKAAAPAATPADKAEPASTESAESTAAAPAPEPKAKGFGMGAAKRPGQKAAAPTAAPADKAEPASTESAESTAAAPAPEPKAKGFGMGAAKRPGQKAAAPTAAPAEKAEPAEAAAPTAEPAEKSEPAQPSEPTADTSSEAPAEKPAPPAKSAGFGMGAAKRPGQRSAASSNGSSSNGSSSNGSSADTAAAETPAEEASTPAHTNGDNGADASGSETNGAAEASGSSSSNGSDDADRVVSETGPAKSAGFGIAAGKKRPGRS